MVAQNCHDPGGEADQPDGGETIGLDGEEAGGEEEGVAGEQREEQTGFDENDEQHSWQHKGSEGPVATQEVGGVEPLRAEGEGGRHGRVGCCQGCNSDHLASICEKCLFPLVEGVVKAACYP